ncbi:hypothetical protein FVE85_9081 [Porphyridium purpureum]|uniref:Uncharacterized protein n=1 Tax=Porphyridium purpureum TaxID=35688 RepID=A0A5J4YMZ0_PORPP|nr:hypothetical protein FVE85_9081 [Porphyridium purpureum]|eukprot:POR7780..scf222_8
MAEKLMKAAFKEGGKRGVELEGASDLSGILFYNVSVETPEGDPALLEKVMEGMNLEVDEAEEERRGGSGKIGKLIVSSGEQQLGLMCYVPTEKLDQLNPRDWMSSIELIKNTEKYSAEIVKEDANTCIAVIKADQEKGIYPIKLRDDAISSSITFLQTKGLFPEIKDDDDDDEFVYGDDDL